MSEGLTKKQIKELRKLEKLQSRNLDQKNSSIKWIAISLVSALFLVLFVGIIVVAKNKNKPTTESGTAQFSNTGQTRMVTTKDGEATNSADPTRETVTLIEYADIQCPACKTTHPIVKALLDTYPNQLKLIFKHYPLTGIHPNAMGAATAAEAAARQNKFFELVDLMYDKQDEWAGLGNPDDKFNEYAKSLGLDVDKFRKDRQDQAITKAINDQRDEGITNGVNGTPTFFLNGERIVTPQDLNSFKSVIDKALKKPAAVVETTQPTSEPTSAPKALPLQP